MTLPRKPGSGTTAFQRLFSRYQRFSLRLSLRLSLILSVISKDVLKTFKRRSVTIPGYCMFAICRSMP